MVADADEWNFAEDTNAIGILPLIVSMASITDISTVSA